MTMSYFVLPEDPDVSGLGYPGGPRYSTGLGRDYSSLTDFESGRLSVRTGLTLDFGDL